MIALTLRADIEGLADEVVCRAQWNPSDDPRDATLAWDGADLVLGQRGWKARIPAAHFDDLAGDVLLVEPRRNTVQRLIRARSKHNTFLITERCDQLCVMCSQPPKKTHVDQFAHFKAAALLAPAEAVIGISGGEPTLFKQQLFDLLEFVASARPDLSFHILSNAQHFTEEDVSFLASPVGEKVLWGVPLYAANANLHDQIVGKPSAYAKLLDGLAILCRAGAATELRTVVMRQNVSELPKLARFITTHVPFADPWAIMQLERIGFARNRWKELFFDHSVDFAPIAEALEIASLHGVRARLYNFPLCTVPRPYRRIAPSTISDWKRRFEPICEDCVARPHCAGFFEWHPSDASYQHLGLT